MSLCRNFEVQACCSVVRKRDMLDDAFTWNPVAICCKTAHCYYDVCLSCNTRQHHASARDANARAAAQSFAGNSCKVTYDGCSNKTKKTRQRYLLNRALTRNVLQPCYATIYSIIIINKVVTGSTKTRQRALTRNALQPCYETINNIIISKN